MGAHRHHRYRNAVANMPVTDEMQHLEPTVAGLFRACRVRHEEERGLSWAALAALAGACAYSSRKRLTAAGHSILNCAIKGGMPEAHDVSASGPSGKRVFPACRSPLR